MQKSRAGQQCLTAVSSVLNVKVLKYQALSTRAFSVILKTDGETDGLSAALVCNDVVAAVVVVADATTVQ